jgi:hypothetical protein
MATEVKLEPMSPRLFELLMEDLASLDAEERHSRADELMCNLLKQLGYGKAVEVFDSWEKWYA